MNPIIRYYDADGSGPHIVKCFDEKHAQAYLDDPALYAEWVNEREYQRETCSLLRR